MSFLLRRWPHVPCKRTDTWWTDGLMDEYLNKKIEWLLAWQRRAHMPAWLTRAGLHRKPKETQQREPQGGQGAAQQRQQGCGLHPR